MAPAIIDRPWVLAGRLLKAKGLTLSAAESCTGGLLSSLITDVPGSSDYFIGSVVAYGNEVKIDKLGVRPATLKRYGAVSGQTAREMALGVKEALKTDASVSITGIAGPGGGSARKPVGTVFICVFCEERLIVKRFLFEGGRRSIKKQSALAALCLLAGLLKEGTLP